MSSTPTLAGAAELHAAERSNAAHSCSTRRSHPFPPRRSCRAHCPRRSMVSVALIAVGKAAAAMTEVALDRISRAGSGTGRQPLRPYDGKAGRSLRRGTDRGWPPLSRRATASAPLNARLRSRAGWKRRIICWCCCRAAVRRCWPLRRPASARRQAGDDPRLARIRRDDRRDQLRQETSVAHQGRTARAGGWAGAE